MKKHDLVSAILAVGLISLLSGTVTGCQPEFQPGTYTDDMGREVSIDQVPQRIVSHVPPITEILFALDLDEKIVGVSDFCDYPEEAKTKPSVGNYYDPSIESIVALNPDLVLTDGHSEGIKQLDNLGIDYLVIDPKDINGIFRDIELLGKVIGVEKRAEKLVNDMKIIVMKDLNGSWYLVHPTLLEVGAIGDTISATAATLGGRLLNKWWDICS